VGRYSGKRVGIGERRVTGARVEGDLHGRRER